jgi:hypothetical protein
MIILKPRKTYFLSVIDCGNGYICLEESSLNNNDTRSNLYKLDRNGVQVWEAEFRSPWMMYCDLTFEGPVLKAHNGAGKATLNPNTGELTNWVLTK